MKRIAFFILFTNTFACTLAQSAATPYPSILQNPVTSHDLAPKEDNVEGSPWLFENWKQGKVILKGGTQYKNLQLNFVPSINKFYFDEHDTSFELMSNVDEVRIRDSSHPDDSNYDQVFRNDVYENKIVKPGTFVEVLTEGKISLYKEYIKQPEGQNSTNGIVASIKKYVLHTTVFALTDDKVIPVKLSLHFLENLTSDRQDQMKEFLKSNELNVRKEAGFKLAISYYNYISSPAFSKKIPI